MRFRELKAVPSRPGLFLHPDAAAWSSGLPDPGSAPRVPGSSRGSVLRVSAGALKALVKRPRRGGLLRSLLPDAFWGAGRSEREALALERLAALGVGPRCLGLQVSKGPLQRPIVAVEEIDGAADLLALARAGRLAEAGLARAAGSAVRRMHAAGVAHRDLNAANIVARREGETWRAWVVDLDDARLLDGEVPGSRRLAEVLRLCRSLDKWEPSSATPAFARASFLRAALPAPLALRALRKARRRHAVLHALGRRPRPMT